MIVLPLSAAELRNLSLTLQSTYTKRIMAQVLNRAGESLGSVSHMFQEGNVVVDGDADVTRALSMKLIDPRHQIGFDADTYQGGLLDFTRRMKVRMIVDGPLLAKPVPIPVFDGPINRLERDGAIVTVEAQGQEMYGLTTGGASLTIPKGARKTDAIERILRVKMGIDRVAIPDLGFRIPKAITITRANQPWKVALSLAAGMGYQLYFDGAGVVRMRKYPTKPIWTFKGGLGGSMTGFPVTTADLEKLYNQVVVTGGKPKGAKVAVRATATAPASHPLSPIALGPPGCPMYKTLEITKDSLRTKKECQELANTRLETYLKLVHDSTFTSVPVPHLDALDMVQIISPFETITQPARRFTIPLGLDDDMEWGSRKRYALHKRKK